MCHRAQANTLTMPMIASVSCLMVSDPSVSLSQ